MGNMFFNEYPYTDFHEMNLSWVLKKIIELNEKLTQFVSLNTIKYADPLEWDITTQYETNTVVIDPNTGTAYLSVQPVPEGVDLSNTDYWTVIFDLATLIGNVNSNLTVHNANTSGTATFDSLAGDWLLWNGKLYEVMSDIYIGYAYVPGANIEEKSVEEFVRGYVASLYTYIGLLSDLQTSDQTSIVNAINEVISVIGALTDLNTTDKTSIVNAINEVLSVIGDLNDLNTTDKTSIVNAINEALTDLTAISNNVGDLNDLSTTDKSSIVNAINEVLSSLSTAISNIDSDLDTILDVNYKKATSFTGANDTEILQNALDGSSMLIMDRDFSISTVTITHPVVFNLGGHKITSTTTDQNTIDITSSNVTVFNGEIYTTVANPSNAELYGSCIYIRPISPYAITPLFNNIHCHDLKLSTNGSHCVCGVGEVYNSIFQNLDIIGNRTNLDVNYEGISFEWFGTPHVLTYHPHDLIFDNINITGYKTASGTGAPFRTSAAFNVKATNMTITDSDAALTIVAGDWAGEAARPLYKNAVNKNITIENTTVTNCRVAVAPYGNTYPSGLIGLHIKNMYADVTVAGIVSRYTTHAMYESIETNGGNYFIDTDYEDTPTYKDCIFHNCLKYGMMISTNTTNITIKNNKFYNMNLSQGTGTNLNGIYNTCKNAIITDNRLLYEDYSYFTTSILNTSYGTESIITDNLVACAISDLSTNSVVDNNIVLTP